MSTITASACPARTLPPTQTGRRAGKQSLHRIFPGHLLRHEAAVAAHNSQRHFHVPLLHHMLHRLEKFRDQAGSAGYLKECPRPLRSTSTSSDISQAVVTGTPSFFLQDFFGCFSKRPPLALGKACSTPTRAALGKPPGRFPFQFFPVRLLRLFKKMFRLSFYKYKFLRIPGNRRLRTLL